MAGKPGKQRTGVGKGQGVTSTGVYYDTRDDEDTAAQSPADIRRRSIRAAQQADARQSGPRKKRIALKRNGKNAILSAGAVLLFAIVFGLAGDAVWDDLLTDKPLPEMTAVVYKRLNAPANDVAPIQEMATEHITAVPEQTDEAVIQAATTAPASNNVFATVWIPVSGSRYHKTDTCSGMKEAKEVSIEQAKMDGFTPCKRCKPPEE